MLDCQKQILELKMNNLKLIFNSFYNIKQVVDYIKNGKGTGLSLLAIVAFLMTIALFAKVSLLLYPELNSQKVEEKVRESFSRLPKIEVADGKLVWEDNVKQTFVLANGLHLTVDTQNDSPTVKDIQNSFIYLSRHKIYVHSSARGQIKDISLSDLQTADGENPLELTSEKFQTLIIKMVNVFIWIFSIFALIIGFFFYWLGNIIFTALTRSIASNFSKTLVKREYFELRRLATMSTIPVIIVIDLMQILFGGPQSWVKWIAILVLGTILMLKYDSMDGKDTTKS